MCLVLSYYNTGFEVPRVPLSSSLSLLLPFFHSAMQECELFCLHVQYVVITLGTHSHTSLIVQRYFSKLALNSLNMCCIIVPETADSERL